MKPERAQELYSDYAEGTLAPALRQALEQHFEANPSARAEYARFARVYALLEQPLEAEVDVPLGFRAKILERVAAEQARRETTFTTRAVGTVTGWFSTVPHRRATGGALAGLAAAALVGVLFAHPGGIGALGGLWGNPSPPSPPLAIVDPAVIQKVDTQIGQDNNTYHQFHLHLPPKVPAATVNAYVVTATEQIMDPAHLSEATSALKAEHLTNHLGISIPIAAAATPPAGATLNLLVQWTPDDPKQESGSEVVFTPFGAANPATAAPVGANFLDAMQALAAHYGATVVVDADSVPTQTVSGDFSAPGAGTPLQTMAAAEGYSVQTLPNNTFYVYDSKS
jgi:hypothetical protein